ncbi:MAG: hypothetical protein PHY45_07935 [Rhodocyclaceae bacterium]|nr:hypothetical protein [Rhodocyclaceae bacterium]
MDTVRTSTASASPPAWSADEAIAPFYAAGAGVLRTTYDAELVRLTRQYAGFAGSTRNALNLIAGLRGGNAITLRAEEAQEDVVFRPPTAPMGWSRVQRILNLARAGLASLDIEAPQPQQIAAALMGGTICVGAAAVVLPGVLSMHSAGIDWTRIAHAFALAAPPPGLRHRQASSHP